MKRNLQISQIKDLERVRLRLELFIRIAYALVNKGNRGRHEIIVYMDGNTRVILPGNTDTIRFEQSGSGRPFRLNPDQYSDSGITSLVDQVITYFLEGHRDQRRLFLARVEIGEVCEKTRRFANELNLTDLHDRTFPVEN